MVYGNSFNIVIFLKIEDLYGVACGNTSCARRNFISLMLGKT